MSASLKAAEITVRVIVLVFQLLAVVGGALLIGLIRDDSNSLANRIGGATICVAGLVSIYEVIMIAFALVERINHPARLIVDIILNSIMAGITVLATVGLIILAIILFILIIAFGAIVVAIFALPIGLGVIYSILFIVSAISAGIIRSKLINEARSSQATSVILAPPPGQTFVVVQQPTAIGQGTSYPLSYNTTFSAPAMPATGDPGVNYNYNYQAGYQPGYPAGTGNKNFQDPTSYGQKPSGVPPP